MHHIGITRTMAAACGPRWRVKATVVACAFFGGCGTYLHDDGLQKKTDTIVTDFKTADISDALASAVAAQQAQDTLAVQDVIARENAARDAILGPLMLQQADGKTPIDHLEAYVLGREARLAGHTYTIAQFNAVLREQDLKQFQAQLQSQKLEVSAAIGRYQAAGGVGEPTCPFDPPPPTNDATLQGLGQQITNLCAMESMYEQQLKTLDGLVNRLSGEFISARSRQAQFDLAASAAHATEDAQSAKLGALKNAVVAAASAGAAASAPVAPASGAIAATPGATADAASAASVPGVAAAAPASAASGATPAQVVKDVPGALKDLADALAFADKAAGLFGTKSPGTALATIKFRKTNLCDVIAAEAGQSCAGATPTPAASDVTAAIGNISAGLSDALTPPDPGVTSVALAYQSAVGTVAQGQLSILDQQAALGEDAVQHLLLELGYLQIAEVQIQRAKAAAPSATCANAGLASALTDHTLDCPTQYREAVSQALVAVNQSFAVGQAVASVDTIKTGKLHFMGQLLAAQQVANARGAVLQIVIGEIGAYGQGGVQPATIAAFLQAFGIVAIAAK